jgi:Tol biopolymer transport system component
VVKVLDFGLAKAIATDGSAAEGSQVPTRTMDGTRAGTILGTAAYMSPEQSRGEAVDKRTDVWAFGCLLYEMLAGRRAFAAASVTETLSEVLKSEPDWQRLHAETPDGVRRLLRRCLAKDRKRRLGDIHDAHLELDDVASSTSDHDRAASARPGRRERFAWASAVGLLVVIAGVLGVRTLRTDEIALRNAPVPAEVRFNVSYPRGVAADYAQLAISPDGQQIVVAPTFEGPERTPLWLRPLGSETGQLLAGTEGAGFPFWSPDGRSIGFFAELKLKRYDVTSQVIQVLADAPSARGGVWQDDGTILFAPSASEPLFRVPATGGTPAMATQLESGQNDHRGPFILPDREHFIYYARGAPQVRGVHVARLDGTDTKRLLDADGAAVYASSGHLLFPRNGELLAQAFDTTRLALDGEPFRVAEAIAVNPGLSLASLSASPSGPIAYGTESIRRTQFTWFDRTGRRLETLGPPDQRTLANPSLSSDGSRVAFSRIVGGNWDVWLIDLQGAVSKATSERVLDFNPVWAPNGRHIFYESNNGSIHMRSVTDGTPEQVLLQERTMVYPSDVSPDGSGLLYTRATGLSTDIYYLPLGADRTPRPFIQTPSQERDAQFFPNGKWVAYQGNETGHFEIYVQPYPGPGHRVQVSTGGGQHVRWARNGSELFYIAGDQRLTSVLVTFGANGTIVVGRPVGLFRTEFDNSFLTRQQYVVSPDGQRFLINAPTDAIEPPSIAMILNWKAIP